MDNAQYYSKEIDEGRDVYIIDKYENRAYKFTPSLGWKNALVKGAKSNIESVCDTRSPSTYERILEGKICTKDEYDRY